MVGGLAAWYWSAQDEYATDIDVVMPYDAAVDGRMAALRFDKQGRYWVLEGPGIVMEAPASELAHGMESVDIASRSGSTVPVLRPEDVVIDRLHQFVQWQSVQRGVQALVLLGTADLDDELLHARAEEEHLLPVLRELRSAADDLDGGSRVAPEQLEAIARRHRRIP